MKPNPERQSSGKQGWDRGGSKWVMETGSGHIWGTDNKGALFIWDLKTSIFKKSVCFWAEGMVQWLLWLLEA